MNHRLNGAWVRRVLVTLGFAILLLPAAAYAYAFHIRSAAATLVNTARQIHSTADAEREIAAWRKRSGQRFWEESDHLGGDHNYDGQIENLLISRFYFVAPSAVTLGITMRDGKLRCLTLVMMSGRYPTGAIWIQEWFDPDPAKDFHISQKNRSRQAVVEFSSSVPEAQRENAFALNLDCFLRTRGCNSAEEILPAVWKLPRAKRADNSPLK